MTYLTFDIPSTSFSIYMTMLDTFTIDSNTVLLTVTTVSKDQKSLSDADKAAFSKPKRK